MANLLALWSGLTLLRRGILVSATLGVFFIVLMMSRLGVSESEALLYAGLDPRSAGEVVSALDQEGVAYSIRGDAIYVPFSRRDALRMQLAGQGLPASGGAGYELLDNLSGFGTTSQMFDAAYWRAKEGELARTLLTMPQVKAARVHVAQTATSAFSNDQSVTASVTVTTTSGVLGQEQADAIRHLVASAVGNLSSVDVAVIDTVAGLIPLPDTLGGSGQNGRAAEIKANVERLLEARVGPGKAVVEVSVDLVRDREAITEKRIDPQGRVVISSETETSSATETADAGAVTVASNLPDGAAAGGDTSKTASNKNRERVNFEVSETQRELFREPGAVRRMTVAVLVDGQRTVAADGSVSFEPRSEGELSDLRELVASASGFDEARGDVLTLKSMEFRLSDTLGTEGSASLLPRLGPIDPMRLIQWGILAFVALLLGLFVVRPMLASRALPAPTPPRNQPLSLPKDDTGSALTGVLDEDFVTPPLSVIAASPDEELPADPVERLRKLIDKRQSESLEILRSWMEKEEEAN